MFRILAAAAVLLLPATAFAQAPAATPPAPAPIEVMVLGVYHMNNPGRDVNNARIDPVTTPEKQAQMVEAAQALARFQPTAIAIERVAPDPSTMLDAGWPAYDPATLTTNADERVQLGHRLADLANVERVYAVDEKDREGQSSYFPYGDLVAWANANGKADVLQAMNGEVQAFLRDREAEQRTKSVGQLLAAMNTPEMARWNGSHYYRFLQFGGGDVLPGAELNGRWYTRNAMIFAKLMQVAKPGDRIVLMFGAGHAYWLRHFVETTPGFRLVEATDYLPPA
ncbi:MAG: hypothetical protein EON91_04245 [Brevundimonas sp.]|uniref:DUF5694 domain-containing protein n=1 Tax=Brevundimonas sp. TaxID=1871086 RepID=UPI00120E498E|nr:DUF5694 domain-containing protein [Brevundimonas sp.]RZJ18647.1 MAG: hypothetical protein EON91_04245 [Brevundimonas sp.]